MAGAVEVVFETEDAEVAIDQEEVVIEVPDTLVDLTFLYGVPLSEDLADPADGTLIVYDDEMGAWMPTVEMAYFDGALQFTNGSQDWRPQITLQHDQPGRFSIFDGGSRITREAVSSGGFPEGNVAIFRNNGTLKATRNIAPSYDVADDFAAWVPEDPTHTALLVEWGGEGFGVFGAAIGEASITSLFKVRTGAQHRTESYVPVCIGDPTNLPDGELFHANYDTGTTGIVPVTAALRSLSDGVWDVGPSNPFARYVVKCDDENLGLEDTIRGGLSFHMLHANGFEVGAALSVSNASGPVVAQTWSGTDLSSSLAGALTVAGALGVQGASGSWIGHTTALSLADGNSASGQVGVPVLGIITSTVSTQLALARWSTSDTGGAAFGAVRSRAAAPGTFTAVQPDDRVFTIFAAADDGTDLGTRVGEIQFEVDDVSGSVGTSQIPGRILFRTAAGLAANDLRTVGSWTASGVFIVGITTSEVGATAGGIKATGASIIGTTMSVGGTISAGAICEANAATGSSSITAPAIFRSRSRSNGGGWVTGASNFWGAYDFWSDDATSPPGPSVRARLSAHMEAAAGDRVGVALFVGPASGPALSQTWNSDLSVVFAGAVRINGNLGVFGGAPVAKPTGVAVTVEAVHAALVTLNLIAA